jgi:hypothetical protein
MQTFANGNIQSLETELAGKKITTAVITTDRDPETRGIGCASRQRLTIIFDDNSAVEFYVGGNFGLAVAHEVDVTLHAVMSYPDRATQGR